MDIVSHFSLIACCKYAYRNGHARNALVCLAAKATYSDTQTATAEISRTSVNIAEKVRPTQFTWRSISARIPAKTTSSATCASWPSGTWGNWNYTWPLNTEEANREADIIKHCILNVLNLLILEVVAFKLGSNFPAWFGLVTTRYWCLYFGLNVLWWLCIYGELKISVW